MGKVWIVLINKSPRGPLTFQEVETLLDEKIINRTDLALKLSEDGQEKSNWKFLWQHPEFDRRLNPNSDSSANPQPSKANTNRRQALTKDQLNQQVSTLMPEEISAINPEDLIVSAQKKKTFTANSLLDSSEDEEIETLPYENKTNSSPALRNSFLLFMALMAGGVYFKGSFFKDQKTIQQDSPKVERPPASLVSKPVISPSPVVTPTPIPSPSTESKVPTASIDADAPKEEVVVNRPKPVPKELRKNEISLEEYRKLKEAQVEKEKLDAEDREKENEERDRLADSHGEDDRRNDTDRDRDREARGREDYADEDRRDSTTTKRVNTKTLVKKRSKREVADENEEDFRRGYDDNRDSYENDER